MSIDMNIDEMFSEKNQFLFLNKLIMDLENNTDTFKIASKSIVMMEIAKLLSSLKKMYDKYSVNYDETKIKELLTGTKKSLLEDINAAISNRYATIKNHIDVQNKQSINKEYLKKYYSHIDESETIFENDLNVEIKQDTEVVLFEQLIKLYPSVSEEMHNDMLVIVNIELTQNLISRIIDESTHRSKTLKNMADESYKKYLELNKSSVVPKKMVKKGN